MNILLLGATSDIARAFIHRIAKAGDRVFLAGRDAGELEAMAADLTMRKGVETMVGTFDAAASGTHAEFVAQAVKCLGGLDGAVLAVGYLGEQGKAEADAAEAEAIIQTNFTAAVTLLEPVAAELEERKAGWILGFSSVAGVRGRKSNYIYGAAKAAFTTYLEGLAHRLTPSGVKVKIALLGFVQSKMTRGMTMPKWAVATPEDAAKGLEALLRSSGQTAYIPGRWWPIMTIIRLLPTPIFNRTKL